MINFEHSSITDTRYAPENTYFLSLKSSYLQGRGECSMYLPETVKGQRNVSCIILLHGVYGSHFSWLYQAGAHEVLNTYEADIYPFILIMPSDGLNGDGSGYLPHKSGLDFEKWIVNDVISAAQHYFSEITEKSEIFISGLSMGGYGALRLGMKYPEKFAGISAHSAITNLDDLQSFIEENIRSKLSEEIIKKSSVISNAIAHRSNLPPLRMDCGTSDPLITSNRRLHEELNNAQINHLYEEFKGEHNYEYWTKHLRDSIEFFSSLCQK